MLTAGGSPQDEATGGVPGLTRRLIELADESGCRHPAHEEEMQCPIFRE